MWRFQSPPKSPLQQQLTGRQGVNAISISIMDGDSTEQVIN